MRFGIDQFGWHPGATQIPSPHFDARPAGVLAELLVIHNISLPPGDFGGGFVDDLFLGRLDCGAHPYFDRLRGLRVSSHFLIRRTGALVQYVSCLHRAWHAGQSTWRGRERCNDFSIGVELEGADDLSFMEVQYGALASLARSLARCYGLVAAAGHSDIAPGRKTDPGPWFDWARFMRDTGLPGPVPASPGE
ncbi:MAG: 1,6-anhydro-N-acetylmuramyl-L-alanine amidase AmpD [Betaproteobacteria bacterium]|nr:1,6-anhydro-N-acetylmuramyl-L-alanine amidase AmpD [Betaproteobacteria bacterium]